MLHMIHKNILMHCHCISTSQNYCPSTNKCIVFKTFPTQSPIPRLSEGILYQAGILTAFPLENVMVTSIMCSGSRTASG